MNWQEHITTDPAIMYGKSVIKGTRIPVDLILEKLALGETLDGLLQAYPTVDRKVLAALIKEVSI